MNNKGEMVKIGGFLMVFVSILVALTLFTGGITGNTSSLLNTESVVNETVTAGAVGTYVDLRGREVVGTPVYVNATTFAAIASTNFTVQNNVIGSDGELTSRLLVNTNSVFANNSINVSYSYKPTSYVDDSGTRSTVSLVVLLTSLAIGLIALAIILKNSKDFF